jgi:hypothetical protein
LNDLFPCQAVERKWGSFQLLQQFSESNACHCSGALRPQSGYFVIVMQCQISSHSARPTSLHAILQWKCMYLNPKYCYCIILQNAQIPCYKWPDKTLDGQTDGRTSGLSGTQTSLLQEQPKIFWGYITHSKFHFLYLVMTLTLSAYS